MNDSSDPISLVGPLTGAAVCLLALLTVAGADPIGALAAVPVGPALSWLHFAVAALLLLGVGTIAQLGRNGMALRREVARLADSADSALGSARRDPLTGLPNRTALCERIDAALVDMWPGLGIAVLVIDIDGFKTVNDVHGRDAGDRVLCEVARRLRAALGFGTTLARLGGDEFAVLVPYSLCHRAAAEAQAVVDDLTGIVRTEDVAVALGASVGVAYAPRDGADTAALLRAADIAMCGAKQNGRGRVQAFDVAMETAIRDDAALKAELPAAIAAGQIVPFYQPIVELQSGAIVEFEVLARWLHPQRGLLTPDRFIHLVEGARQATPMLLALLRRVAADAVAWPGELQFSVNVFPAQLLDASLVEVIEQTAAEGGLRTSRLCLEVTEHALVHDSVRARAVIDAAHRAGMAVALDDFGTGYSSLYHLRELPFDRLKIDRSFVQPVDADGGGMTYVAAIVALCRALGLHVVAEGIEHAGVARLLAEMGCDFGQGYHYSRPIPAAQVPRLLGQIASRTAVAA